MGEEGHSAIVFAVTSTRLHADASEKGLAVHSFNRQPRYFAGPSARKLAPILKEAELDALWVRDPRDLSFAGILARRCRIPLIFQQGMQIGRPKRHPWHSLRFGRVTRWVSPTPGLAQQALALTPLTQEQVCVIPLALEDSWFIHPPSASRSKWEWPEGVRIVGLFGRLDPLKGQAELLRAAAPIDDLHIWLIGESTVNESGDYQNALAQLALALGMADRVRIDPPTENLQSAYDALDAFAMCSASETFGMVTIEALSRGIPIIGTCTGGTVELLKNQPGTTTYNPGDVGALTAALDAIPPPSERKLYQRHLGEFQRTTAVQSWSRLLREIAGSKGDQKMS